MLFNGNENFNVDVCKMQTNKPIYLGDIVKLKE